MIDINQDHEESGRRVLVVEDEVKLRAMLVAALTEMGFDAHGAESGEAGIGCLERDAYDIAVVDLNLPGMHGLDFCETIRARWPHTQMLILTGYGDLEAAKRAMRLDVVDFLGKPCQLADLEVALDRAMRRRRNHIVAHRVDDEQQPVEQPAAAAARGGRTIEELERAHILDALARNGGNRKATAIELGLSIRTLYYRLSVYERQGYFTRKGDE